MRSLQAARVALWLLCISAASVGLPATIAPHTFYADFPFFDHWVDLLPPYNEHLTTDVGGLYLASPSSSPGRRSLCSQRSSGLPPAPGCSPRRCISASTPPIWMGSTPPTPSPS